MTCPILNNNAMVQQDCICHCLTALRLAFVHRSARAAHQSRLVLHPPGFEAETFGENPLRAATLPCSRTRIPAPNSDPSATCSRTRIPAPKSDPAPRQLSGLAGAGYLDDARCLCSVTTPPRIAGLLIAGREFTFI